MGSLSTPGAILTASTLVGLVVFWFFLWLTTLATQPRNDELLTPGERSHRQALRARSSAYRWFEPLVDRLAKWQRSFLSERWLKTLQHNLDFVEPESNWRAGEYLAVREVEGIMLIPAVWIGTYAVAGIELAWPLAIVGYFLLGPVLAYYSLASQAKYRLDRIRARLPFAIDLIALMLESGSILRECLERAAEENRGHPLGEELDRVCASIRRGSTQADALREMGRRLDDGIIHEVVFAINSAEDSSGEVKEALRNLAEQVRTRRIQWLERAAEEAKVQITWPGLLIMIACLLIVVAPIWLAGMGRR
jgi:tight adherence protein C